MRRLIFVAGLIYFALVLLLLLDDDARSEAVACGDPPPTATSGPPTATRVPPTASPRVIPTVDLDSLPIAEAPVGLHAIAACETRDQVRATLNLLVDLLEGWELVPIGKGPPPEMSLVIFEDPADSQRTISLAIYDTGGKAGRSIARGFQERSDVRASITADGKLVWVRHERDGNSLLTWGAINGARRYSIAASHPADVRTMLDALTRAAEHSCYPDCQ